jgi:MFS transporter, CP family, cyanate transporter
LSYETSARRFYLVATVLWLCGSALRIPILALPPILPLIQADLRLTGTQIGVLSGLPVFMFAVFALPGSLLIARCGAACALLAGLLIAAAGTALRGAAVDVLTLCGATIIMGAGVAVMQPAMPVAVRQWLPTRIPLATAVYTNGLIVGEIVSVASMLPLVLPLVDGSWRVGLAVWAIPLLGIALLLGLTPRTAQPTKAGVTSKWWPDWTISLTWRLGLLLATCTSMYFGANAFLPGYLIEAHRPDLVGAALTGLNIGQLPASVLLLAIVRRLQGRIWPYVVFGLLAIASVAGIVSTAGLWTVAWATLLGFAAGGALVLILALPALLCAPADVARMSGAMLAIGFFGAMLVSIISGAAWDVAGAASFAFLPVGLSALPLIVVSPTLRLAVSGDGQP